MTTETSPSLLDIKTSAEFFAFFENIGCKLHMYPEMLKSVDFYKSMHDKPYVEIHTPRLMSQRELIYRYAGTAFDYKQGTEHLAMGLRSFILYLEQNKNTSLFAYVSFLSKTGENKIMFFSVMFDMNKAEIYGDFATENMANSIAVYAGGKFLCKTTQ